MENTVLSYVVIIARSHGKWVFCKHKNRGTWECPGGHIEAGEAAFDAAKRELYEETGASVYEIQSICMYGVENTKTGYADYDFCVLRKFRNLTSYLQWKWKK